MLQLSGSKLLGYLVARLCSRSGVYLVIIGLLSGIFYNSADAQTDSLCADTSVHIFAEKMPEYSGGMEKFYVLLNKNMKWDCVKDTNNAVTCSKVLCDFVVDTTGVVKVVDAFLCREQNSCLRGEFERVFKMGDKWNPGEINGKAVAVRMKIPVLIHFK